MSLASPIARSLEEQAHALVSFLAAQDHTLALTDAQRVCTALPADPKAAAKQLKNRLSECGVLIKHTHALKAVAVLSGTETFLGLGAAPRWDLASWSPDSPGTSAKRALFTSIGAAGDELCRRIRDELEDATPYARVRVAEDHFDLRVCSPLTGSWWRSVLVAQGPDGGQGELPQLEARRLAERVRRLVEGELGGWVDGMAAFWAIPEQGGDYLRLHAYLNEAAFLQTVFENLGIVEASDLPADCPPDADGIQQFSLPVWQQLRQRAVRFAAKHGQLPGAFAFDAVDMADEDRFEPEPLNMGVVETARIRLGLSLPDIAAQLPHPERQAAKLREGRLDLRHFPDLAKLLKLASPNDLLSPKRSTPRIPLPHHTDIGLWLSRLDGFVSEPPDAPRAPSGIAARLQALCAVPYEQRKHWDKNPPKELETLNREVRFAGLVVCAGMGIRFVQDLPLGIVRPSSLSLLEFDREVDVLTQNGQMAPDNGLMRLPPEQDAVTPEWLARFNAVKFTARDLLRYSDKVEEMRDPDGDSDSKFHVSMYAAAKVFGKNPDKAHTATVRMEAMSRLVEKHAIDPWVRKGASGDGSLMLSQAAFEAAAKCPLVDVDGRPGFDFKTFYLLCAEHERA